MKKIIFYISCLLWLTGCEEGDPPQKYSAVWLIYEQEYKAGELQNEMTLQGRIRFDLEGRMVYKQEPDIIGSTEYRYDVQGRLILKIKGTWETRYTYNTENLLIEENINDHTYYRYHYSNKILTRKDDISLISNEMIGYWTYSYTNEELIEKEIYHDKDGKETAHYIYQYDDHRNLILKQRNTPKGEKITEYEARYTYDSRNRISTKIATAPGIELYYWKYEYSYLPDGKVEKEIISELKSPDSVPTRKYLRTYVYIE